jgi:hypothetical protein
VLSVAAVVLDKAVGPVGTYTGKIHLDDCEDPVFGVKPYVTSLF